MGCEPLTHTAVGSRHLGALCEKPVAVTESSRPLTNAPPRGSITLRQTGALTEPTLESLDNLEEALIGVVNLFRRRVSRF